MSKNVVKFLGLFLAMMALHTVILQKSDASYVIDYADEKKACASQKRVWDDVKKKKYNKQLDKIQNLIRQNENEIKHLERDKREKLDHELAVLLQNREDLEYRLNHIRGLDFLNYFDNKKNLLDIDCKIRKIRRYIEDNERKIKELKNKRTQLDHEYAVILANE
jgi:predicted ribosome quality control (RQC) complex YloA/Tae2 family protein